MSKLTLYFFSAVIVTIIAIAIGEFAPVIIAVILDVCITGTMIELDKEKKHVI